MVVCRLNASNYVIHYLTKSFCWKINRLILEGFALSFISLSVQAQDMSEYFTNVTKDIIYQSQTRQDCMVMSDQNFVLSDLDGILIGQMSF